MPFPGLHYSPPVHDGSPTHFHEIEDSVQLGGVQKDTEVKQDSAGKHHRGTTGEFAVQRREQVRSGICFGPFRLGGAHTGWRGNVAFVQRDRNGRAVWSGVFSIFRSVAK